MSAELSSLDTSRTLLSGALKVCSEMSAVSARTTFSLSLAGYPKRVLSFHAVPQRTHGAQSPPQVGDSLATKRSRWTQGTVSQESPQTGPAQRRTRGKAVSAKSVFAACCEANSQTSDTAEDPVHSMKLDCSLEPRQEFMSVIRSIITE